MASRRRRRTATLATLNRDRISQRVLGNFGFSDVLRSLDGAQYVFNTPKLNFTGVSARPTEGVFQVNGWNELHINVFYGALTGQGGERKESVAVAGLRAWLRRLPRLRRGSGQDRQPLRGSEGCRHREHQHRHLWRQLPPAGGDASWPRRSDVLGCAAGRLVGHALSSRRAMAAEVGWQPSGLPKLKPWIRAGYDYSAPATAIPQTTSTARFSRCCQPRASMRACRSST